MRSRPEMLSGLRSTQADVRERVAHETVGTRKHELLLDLDHHLGRVIEITEELFAIEPEVH